jgi:very-short-patch-repair endonuclease
VGDSRGSRRPNRLAVDAYYPKHKLVIEFNERQHDEAVKFFDKPDRITASGVHRGEQRKIYDNRRAELLPKNGIKLIVLRYDQFLHNSNRKLRRIPTDDLQTIRDILQNLQIKID